MKKVLSYVLVLALVLSSFSMAFAGSATELKSLSDIAGNKNAEAVEVNYDLGIVTGNPDGTFQPEKAVTRAEFAAMITRALAIPQSALAGYANTNFKDAAGYTWAVPYLAFANSKGIMLGDGAGNAMPGKTITVNEAVTMTLRALGYVANSSELTGVWPSNYVTKAQELKLYDDVAKDATGVDKANAAQIIYNALTVQKVAVNSDGKTEKLWDKSTHVVGVDETTLLSSGLNCTAEPVDALASSEISESLINAAKYLGQHGTLYKNSDEEIVAFITKDCTQIVGRFTDEGKFTTTDDEKEYSFVSKALTNGAFVMENGENKTTWDQTSYSAITKGMASPEYVMNADISGKTIKTIYSVNRWVAKGSDQVAAGDIADIKDAHSLLNVDFAEDDNDEIDYTQFQLVGVNSLADIKADNVVYVYGDNKIRRIEVGTAVAEGVVKNFKSAKRDITTKFAIGANTYRNASEALNNITGGDTVESGNVSDEVKAFLDARGYVYDFKASTGATNFAVIERAGSTVSDQVKLMLADGSEKTFNYDNASDKAGNLLAGSIIGYGLDKNGEITDSNLNYITADGITLSSTKVIKAVDNPMYATGSNIAVASATAIKNTKIAENCVVFTYKATTTAITNAAKTPDGVQYITDYDVTTIDKVDIDKYIGGQGVYLLFDEENNGKAKTDKVVAMFISEQFAKSGTKSYAVINELNKDVNADNDKVFKVVGYLDGKKMDTYTDDWSGSFFDGYNDVAYQVGAGTMNGMGTVRLYQVKTDAKGIITDATYFAADVADLSGDTDLNSTKVLQVKSADKKSSIVSDTVATGTRYAISDKAVIYQVTDDDEFKTSSSDLKKGDDVILYETDDDNDGYDIVIFARYNRNI